MVKHTQTIRRQRQNGNILAALSKKDITDNNLFFFGKLLSHFFLITLNFEKKFSLTGY